MDKQNCEMNVVRTVKGRIRSNACGNLATKIIKPLDTEKRACNKCSAGFPVVRMLNAK